jgi:hypothetical protein
MSSLYQHGMAALRVIAREIQRERARARPDDMRLQRLKKEKLALKDRLVRHGPRDGNVLRYARAVMARLKRAYA